MSCDDFRLSRRRFLAGTGALIGGAAVSGMIGDVFTQTAYGAPGGNTLVVLSLRGGSDGLSMIVPHGDPGYAKARPTIGLPTGSLLAKDSMFGLHPEFEPVLPMWQSGKFGAVQAVGLRVPNRSHFAAMEAVEDADPGSSARIGWLNRMIGLTAGGRAPGGPAARAHHAADRAGRPGVRGLGPAAVRLPAAGRRRGRGPGPDAGGADDLVGRPALGHGQGGPGGARSVRRPCRRWPRTQSRPTAPAIPTATWAGRWPPSARVIKAGVGVRVITSGLRRLGHARRPGHRVQRRLEVSRRRVRQGDRGVLHRPGCRRRQGDPGDHVGVRPPGPGERQRDRPRARQRHAAVRRRRTRWQGARQLAGTELRQAGRRRPGGDHGLPRRADRGDRGPVPRREHRRCVPGLHRSPRSV